MKEGVYKVDKNTAIIKEVLQDIIHEIMLINCNTNSYKRLLKEINKIDELERIG